MPQNVLKWVARSNVVRIKENVEAARGKEIVQLHSRAARLDPAITDKHSPLATQQANTLQ